MRLLSATKTRIDLPANFGLEFIASSPYWCETCSAEVGGTWGRGIATDRPGFLSDGEVVLNEGRKNKNCGQICAYFYSHLCITLGTRLHLSSRIRKHYSQQIAMCHTA